MVLMQIVVFKCKVNVCDQDLGAFCREWDPETKERFCGQLVATKQLAEEVLEALMEVEPVLWVVAWTPWALGSVLGVIGWLAGLQSLLGWLWWLWIVLLGMTAGRCGLSPSSSPSAAGGARRRGNCLD